MKKQPKTIAFICVENARRSQMAAGFAERIGREKVEVFSAGSRPAAQIDPMIIEVMKEKGIDLSSRLTRGLNDLPPVEMDYLVTMGCEETCPAVAAKKIIEWQIPDLKGKPIDEVRRIRDVLEAKVKMLVEEVDS